MQQLIRATPQHTCAHTNLAATVNVDRAEGTAGRPSTLSIRCAECGCPFVIVAGAIGSPTPQYRFVCAPRPS